MSLEQKDVLHVAKLSALELNAEEVEEFTKDLGDIIGYVERLNAVSVNGVVPTSHVHGLVNRFRDDLAKNSLPLKTVADMAPEFKGGGFRVPKVI